MQRYGEMMVGFVERDDPTHNFISYGGVSMLGGIEKATIIKKLGQASRGQFTLLKTIHWEQFVQEGRIAGLSANDKVNEAATGSPLREFGQFLVQNMREVLAQDGKQRVEVDGLGPESLLMKYRLWWSIGEKVTYSTYVTEEIDAPWTTTVAGEGIPGGNDSVLLTSTDGLQNGDEIRIQMDNGDWFVGKVTEIDPPGVDENHIQFQPRIPAIASGGNDVEFRKCRVKVNDTEGFEIGQEMSIERDDGPNHITKVAVVHLDTNVIEFEAGMVDSAGLENIVQTLDYSTPAADDVEQIMAPALAEGWQLIFGTGLSHGTATGSAHAPYGESIWELLTALGEEKGENFRLGVMSGGFTPRKRLYWFKDWDSSGMTLYLRAGTEDVDEDTENVNRGVIRSLVRERSSDIITRVYAVSGDGRIDLSNCTAEAVADAAAEGFTVVISTDLYQPDYVQYGPGVTEHGVLEGMVRAGGVSLGKKAKLAEIQQASDSMLWQAVNAIKESQTREYWRVKVHCHRPLYPGQSVALNNMTGVHPIVNGTYYILEVRENYESRTGVIETELRLSTAPLIQPTGVVRLGRMLKATEQAGRRMGLVAAEGVTTRGGVVSGGTATHEHAELLKVDGTRALVGNMAVADGVTVDGVDISAHAANPSAHHAPVTAADGSIAVAGQAVRVADAFAGAGLALSGGVAAVNTGISFGTVIQSDVVGVAVDPAGGLEVGGSGTRLKRPTNSGIALDTTGARLVPQAVGANTASGVSGTEHTHTVLAYADSKAAPGQLMKSTADGDHTLRWLTADRVRTPLIDTAAGTLTLDPAGGLVNVDGDVTLTGGSRWLRTATSDLTLAPVGELHFAPGGGVAEVQPSTTMKTAHWASGFLGTGWGHTYDGHLDTRSIYADELHVAAFIADTARVVVGSEYITPGMALLAEDFTVPSVGGVGTLVVEDAPGLPNLPVFDNRDWVLLRIMNRAGGGLLVANVWGQVTNYSDGPEEGQQSWTFTCKQTSAAQQRAAGGSVALGFGKSGAGWWWVTAIDPAGAPYAGISTWQGDNPYTDANRSHLLRMGQLRGVTGVHEFGIRMGETTSQNILWSNVRGGQITGARQSFYAGDGAQLRVAATEVRLYRDVSNFSTLLPNADHSAVNVVSSGGALFAAVDEGMGAVNTGDWIANGLNTSGSATLGLSDPSPWGAPYAASVRASLVGSGFSNDTVRLFAQVVAADDVTALTSEKLVYSMTGNTTISLTVNFDQVDGAATQAQWNGARLRLRWEYVIAAADEVIRFDPQTPSIAVGRGLPTGYAAGGDGFWVGADAGEYKLRIGKAAGVGLHWTGEAVELRNSAGQAVILLNATGSSRFEREMTLGALGGIWQGTGSFAAPTTGLKLWNDGGFGRLAGFNAGVLQVQMNTAGRFEAGAGKVVMDAGGLTFIEDATTYVAGRSSEIKFKRADGTQVGYIAGGFQGGLRLGAGVGPDSNYQLMNTAGWTAEMARVEFNARSGAVVGQLALGAGSFALTTTGGAGLASVGAMVNASGLRAVGALVVGDAGSSPPDTAVLRLKERTTAAGHPPAGFAQIWVQDLAGVQKLYIRFENGVIRELASA